MVISVLTGVAYGTSGWAARYWPAQLALGGALLALAVGQAAATFRAVEAGTPCDRRAHSPWEYILDRCLPR